MAAKRKPLRRRRGYSGGGEVEAPDWSQAKPRDTRPEPLPGVTSGPAGKPWGLNRDQPLYKSPTSGSGFIDNTLARVRPADPTTDRNIPKPNVPESSDREFNFDGAVPPPRKTIGLAKGGKVRRVLKKVRRK